MEKCEKCDLNFISEDEEHCIICINSSGESILGIVLNINRDLNILGESPAHAKLEFGELDLELIYQRTRSMWKIAENRINTIKYVVSIVNRIILGVWTPLEWNDVFDTRTGNWRKEFDGEKADKAVLNKFFGRDISSLINKGEQNPVKYFREQQILSCPSLAK